MSAEGYQYINTAEFTTLKQWVGWSVAKRGTEGATVDETIAHLSGLSALKPKIKSKLYYGPISGALSALANEHQILVRLKSKRAGHSIYVWAKDVNNRPAWPARPPKKASKAPAATAPATATSSTPEPAQIALGGLTPEVVEQVLTALIEASRESRGRVAFSTFTVQTINAARRGNVLKINQAHSYLNADNRIDKS